MTNQLDDELRDLLHHRASSVARTKVSSAAVIRRARRRLATNAAVVGVASAAVVIGSLALVRSPSQEARPAPPPVSARQVSNGEIVVLGRASTLVAVSPDDAAERLLVRPPGDGNFGNVHWSPDGSRLAFLFGQMGGGSLRTTLSLYVVDANGAHLRRLTGCPHAVSCDPAGGGEQGFAWSPDSRYIALAANGGLYRVNVSSGATQHLAVGPVSWTAWSPTGGLLAYVTLDGHLHLLSEDGAGDRVLRQLTNVERVEFSPDGGWLAVSTSDGIHIARTDGSEERHLVVATAAEGPFDATWSPDQRHLLFFATPKVNGDLVPRVRVVDVRTGHVDDVFASRLPVSDWSPPTWSPDGQRIAFLLSFYGDKSAGSTLHLYVMHADGTGRRLIPVDNTNIVDTTWRGVPPGQSRP